MIRVCVFVAINAVAVAAGGSCEAGVGLAPREGNIGESGLFPWLGVLRVHIHQGEVFKVALTGLALVKEGYAIANADDVARIPKRIFKQDSKAMFIASAGQPWYCGLRDYMTHPEYEYSTTNTIALVELDAGERTFPMRPICWPSHMYNTSNQLYAIGFTDDNEILEKSVFAIQYVQPALCAEFYNRVGLMDKILTPTHFICGFAKQNKENCVWDNGIVLASNTSKFWRLVGFGVRGPGCAAPARFIDLQAYFPWIESATNFEEVDDETNYRKSAFNEGFKPRRKGESTEEGELPDLKYMIQNHYPFNTERVQAQYFTIDRIDENAINIRNISLPASDGNCSIQNSEILYKDIVTVTAAQAGALTYKLSMYDLFAMNYTCVKISIVPEKCNDTATLFYMAKIDNMEGSSFRNFGTTPEKLLQLYPVPSVTVKPDITTTTHPKDWRPAKHMKVAFLEDENPYVLMENYNIYLKFEFENRALIEVEVLGPLWPPAQQTTTTTTEGTLREGVEIEETNEDKASTLGTSSAVPPSLVVPTPTSPGLARSALVSSGGKTTTWPHAALLLLLLRI